MLQFACQSISSFFLLSHSRFAASAQAEHAVTFFRVPASSRTRQNDGSTVSVLAQTIVHFLAVSYTKRLTEQHRHRANVTVTLFTDFESNYITVMSSILDFVFSMLY